MFSIPMSIPTQLIQINFYSFLLCPSQTHIHTISILLLLHTQPLIRDTASLIPQSSLNSSLLRTQALMESNFAV